MDGRGPSALFVGDLGDPWVAAIASALPRGASRLHCAGDLPNDWPAHAQDVPAVVLHRPILSPVDLDRLRLLRNRMGGPPRIILCTGPLVRYHQLERWTPHVEAILPEATAAEVVAYHLFPPGMVQRPQPSEPPPVAIVSSNFELRLSLADACRRSGYDPQPVSDWPDAPNTGLAVWDVPILSPAWGKSLARAAPGRSIIALIGFADRAVVTLANDHGASACLDLPCEPGELVFVLDRLCANDARSLPFPFDPPHAIPPAPVGLHRHAKRRVVGRRGEPYNP